MKTNFFIVMLGVLLLSGCSSMQSRFTYLDKSYPALSADAAVEVFYDQLPTRPFVKVARLDVHLEKTHFLKSDLQDALPSLEQQARRAGANAIIEIKERTSKLNETKIYHVTAIGIRYTD